MIERPSFHISDKMPIIKISHETFLKVHNFLEYTNIHIKSITKTDSFLLETYGLRVPSSYNNISHMHGYFSYEILDEKKLTLFLLKWGTND